MTGNPKVGIDFGTYLCMFLGQGQGIPSLLIAKFISQVLHSGAHVPVGITGQGATHLNQRCVF